jgi:CRP-like cAMP-binding protein
LNATGTAPLKRDRLGDIVVRRLSGLCPLSETEISLVRNASARSQYHQAGQFLQHEEEAPAAPKYVVSGWACRHHALADGRRQIFSFVLPGDPIGLHRGARPLARSSILALTEVVTIDAKDIDGASTKPETYRSLACAVDKAAQEQSAFTLNQIVRIGRLTAYERVAHVMMELHYRLSNVGLNTGQTMPCPLTQDVLADTLGLSTVHINRTLKQLRREELLEIRSGRTRLMNIDVLTAISGFRAPKTQSEFEA